MAAFASRIMKARRSVRVGGVERQIGAAGLENAEQADDHLGRALDAQTDNHFGTDAACPQMMRQLVGAGVEIRIGQRCVFEHHGDGIGGAGDLGFEQLRQGGWMATRCAVSFHARRMV